MRRLRKEKVEKDKPHHYVGPTSGRQSGLRILNARCNETNDFSCRCCWERVRCCRIAQEVTGSRSGSLKMDRNGEYLVVEMDVELSAGGRGEPRRTSTPRLVNGADSADLSAIGIYGRRRYHMRNGAGMLSGDGGQASRPPKTRTGSLSRHRAIRRMDERRGARLSLRLRLLQHDARRTTRPAGALRGTRPHSPAGL